MFVSAVTESCSHAFAPRSVKSKNLWPFGDGMARRNALQQRHGPHRSLQLVEETSQSGQHVLAYICILRSEPQSQTYGEEDIIVGH